MVSAPLAVGNVELGRLVAFDADPPPEDTHRRVRAMADLIAMAVWNSRLTKDRARLGMIEERNRLARELHDGLTQRFYAIQLQLQSALSALELHDTAAGVGHIEVAGRHAHDGLDEARRSVRGLRERGIESQSLTVSLRDLATRYEAETGTACRLIIRGDDDLTDTDTKSALARSVQELLHNVEKHAAAASVSIVLAFASDALSVNIADDGHGFALHNAADAGTGYGLFCVRERMAAIGGQLELRSAPGQGTVANLVVPRSAN